MADLVLIGVLVALSFLPPLLFLLWIRRGERRGREPVPAVLRAFLYGGTIGIIVALALHILFNAGTYRFAADFGFSEALLTVVIAAPFVEELAKGLGLGTIRRNITEWEDGIIYGAAIGLGFAATENLVYALAALAEEGAELAIQTAVIRQLSSTILHATASSFLGFGYGLIVLRGGVVPQLLPYYLIAVFLHAVYNFLVFTQTYLGFVASIFMVWFLFASMQRRIRKLDALPHDIR